MREYCEKIKQEGYRYYDIASDLIRLKRKVEKFGDNKLYNMLENAQDRYADRGEVLLKEAEDCQRRSI
jgi:hypothetical protein